MGEVYLAEHPRLPRRIALKVLPADVSADAEYRARFNREEDLASTLCHPHIASVHCRAAGRAGVLRAAAALKTSCRRWHGDMTDIADQR